MGDGEMTIGGDITRLVAVFVGIGADGDGRDVAEALAVSGELVGRWGGREVARAMAGMIEATVEEIAAGQPDGKARWALRQGVRSADAWALVFGEGAASGDRVSARAFLEACADGTELAVPESGSDAERLVGELGSVLAVTLMQRAAVTPGRSEKTDTRAYERAWAELMHTADRLAACSLTDEAAAMEVVAELLERIEDLTDQWGTEKLLASFVMVLRNVLAAVRAQEPQMSWEKVFGIGLELADRLGVDGVSIRDWLEAAFTTPHLGVPTAQDDARFVLGLVVITQLAYLQHGQALGLQHEAAQGFHPIQHGETFPSTVRPKTIGQRSQPRRASRAKRRRNGR